MNKKLIIKNQKNEVLQTCIFHEQETLDLFIRLLAEQCPWGKPEQIVLLYPEIIEDGVVIQEAVYETIPAEYEIEIVDVSSQLERESKLKAIEELEAQITPRRIREAIISSDNSFIVNIENQIQQIRSSL